MQLISSAQLAFTVTEGGAEFRAPWQTYCRAPAQIKFTALRLKDKLVSFREPMLLVVKLENRKDVGPRLGLLGDDKSIGLSCFWKGATERVTVARGALHLLCSQAGM